MAGIAPGPAHDGFMHVMAVKRQFWTSVKTQGYRRLWPEWLLDPPAADFTFLKAVKRQPWTPVKTEGYGQSGCWKIGRDGFYIFQGCERAVLDAGQNRRIQKALAGVAPGLARDGF